MMPNAPGDYPSDITDFAALPQTPDKRDEVLAPEHLFFTVQQLLGDTGNSKTAKGCKKRIRKSTQGTLI